MCSSGCIRVVMFCALAVAILLPSTGCGTKKKGKKGRTIAQQREDAKAESTPDRRAAAFIKLARQQAAAGDKTGAKASALDAYREFYPSESKKPVEKEKPAEPAEEKKPEDGEEPKPEDEAAPTEDKAPAEEPAPEEPAPEESTPPEEQRPAIDANLAGPRLVEIAEVFAMLGDKKQARNALGKAEADCVEKIEDPVRKAKVLADAGAIYGAKTEGIGDAGKAKVILAKAEEVAGKVDERFRADALAAVAIGYARSNLANLAEKTVKDLENAANKLDEPRAKAEALAAAANVKAQTGKKEEAKKLLEEAASAAKSVERADGRAFALIAIAIATKANGDVKESLKLLKDADKAANKASEPDVQKMLVEKVNKLTMEFSKKK